MVQQTKMSTYGAAGRTHYSRGTRRGFKSFHARSGAKARFRPRVTIRTRGGFGPTVVRPIVVPGMTRSVGFFGRFGRGGELKFHDVDLDDAVVATGGTVVPTINIIPQGTSEIQRIGRKCTIRSINWRFQVQLPAGTSTAGTADTLRVIMYLDKQANGATAAVTDILESADFQSFNNLGNKNRFRTLMDRRYDLQTSLSGDGTTVDSGLVLEGDTFFKKCNIPIEFSSTNGTITEIRSNNIGVLLISSQGVAGFVSKLRLRFSDN